MEPTKFILHIVDYEKGDLSARQKRRLDPNRKRGEYPWFPVYFEEVLSGPGLDELTWEEFGLWMALRCLGERGDPPGYFCANKSIPWGIAYIAGALHLFPSDTQMQNNQAAHAIKTNLDKLRSTIGHLLDIKFLELVTLGTLLPLEWTTMAKNLDYPVPSMSGVSDARRERRERGERGEKLSFELSLEYLRDAEKKDGLDIRNKDGSLSIKKVKALLVKAPEEERPFLVNAIKQFLKMRKPRKRPKE